MMKDYLLSVIIPTKNRQKYCLEAVKHILSLGFDNLQICIQDNSDTDSLRQEIHNLDANDIVYNHNSGILSFVDNFSESVSLAEGEYSCMIGDDDSVLPIIMEEVKKAKKENLDAIIPSLGAVYFWPSDYPIIPNGYKGVLQVSHRDSVNSMVSSQGALKSLLSNGVQNYASLDIPRLYHGIVRTSSLEKIKSITGNYFGGLTPDMYMATALCFVCNKVMRISYPITISGICATSGSNDSASGKHTGDLKDAPHFRGHTNYEWDDLIAPFYSVDTIWADTLLHALRDFKCNDYVNCFNLKKFSAICFYKYPAYRKLIIEHANKHDISTLALILEVQKYRIELFNTRVISRFRKESFRRWMDIDNIFDACRLIEDFYKSIITKS